MPLPPGISLRFATEADVEASADCHLACWREAYTPLADPERLAVRLADRARWVERTREHLRAGPPRLLAWRSSAAGPQVIGLACAGPSRDDDPPTPEELMMLYVRAAWHGTGVAQALLDGVIADRPCSLWVLEGNLRAQAFYARNGFAPDGARELYEGLGAWELRMVRR